MRNLPSTAGRVVVYKSQDDKVEKIFESNNIVTIGFGVNLSNFFTSDSRAKIENIIPQYCQVGTGVVNYLADTSEFNNYFYQLNSPLSKASYGRNLRRKIVTLPQITDIGNVDSLEKSTYSEGTGSFLQIPKSAITIKKDNGINVRIVLDKTLCNGNTLREIGLFTGSLSADGTNKLLLSCYKQFPPIAKTNEFSLIFEWTIQATDFESVLVWQSESEYNSTIGTTRPGGGGGPRQPAPTFNYRYGAGADSWDVRYPLTNYPPITPGQNPANSFVAGSFGFTSNSIAEATASGFSISAINGAVSAVGPAVPANGAGTLYVSATPVNTNYGPYTAPLRYEIALGKTVTDPGATYIGQIGWKVPSNAPFNASTVIRCVVPTSSGDFTTGTWGNYTNWLISGVDTETISPISGSGIIAQIEAVQKNASGGYETVEVIFPTVIKFPGQTQYYDIYTASDALTGTPPQLDTSAFVNIKVKDLSGNVYKIEDPTLFTSGNLAASSLLKSGPYLQTYKFVYRLKPEATANPLFPDPNNIEHKPYGLTAYIYTTVKKYDPTYKIDIRIANGMYLLPTGGWGGGGNDGVGAVMNTNTIPQIRDILGNFYYANMWMEHSTELSAVHHIETYNVSYDADYFTTNGVERVFLVSPYAASGETKYGWNESLSFEENIKWKCHVFPKFKHFSRRFVLTPANTTYSYGYLKESANYADVAFPTRGRSWYNIPKWGPVGDLAPNYSNIANSNSVLSNYKEFWDITRRPNSETWILPGATLRDSLAFLYNIKFQDLELVAKAQIWNGDNSRHSYGPANLGTLAKEEIGFNGGFKAKLQNGNLISNQFAIVDPTVPGIATHDQNFYERSQMPYITKLPFNTLGQSDPDDGGLVYLNFFSGGSLTRDELNYLGLKCQYITQRTPWIYNVSGIPVSVGDVMDAYGFTPSTAGNIDVFDHFYLLYHGQTTDNNANHYWTLPYSFFAWKSNSKIAEPYENILRLDDVNSPQYLSNIFQSASPTIGKLLVNKCPYSYKVMTFSSDRMLINGWGNSELGGADKIFGREHISRIYPILMTQCQLTNDCLLKDEFEMFASLCAHTYPPYPTSVKLKGLTPAGTATNSPVYHNRFTATKYLAAVSGVDNNGLAASGKGFVFQNTRGTVHPVAAMAGYYSFAPSSWKSKNEASIDFMASGFHYSWIRENGHIGCDYITAEGNPYIGGIQKALMYGHSLSSTPSDASKVAFIDYPLANSQPYVPNNTLVNQNYFGLNTTGNYFAASTLGDQTFMLSYQSLAFAMLAKHALRYRQPVLYESIKTAVATQASSMVFDVFNFVSGAVGVSDLGVYLKDSQNAAFYDSVLNSTSDPYNFIITDFTKNRKFLSGTFDGVNLPTVNTTLALQTLATIPNNQISNYLSPVDSTKVLGGFPNIVGTITDCLNVSAFPSDSDNSYKYRGGKKNGTVVIPKQGFSGVDYDNKNLRGDRVRTEDCFVFFSNGMMADKNWDLSMLDTSNTFIPIAAMMGNSYYNTYELPGANITLYASYADKTNLINYAIAHYINMAVNKGTLHLAGPVLAYLKYLNPFDQNGQ